MVDDGPIPKVLHLYLRLMQNTEEDQKHDEDSKGKENEEEADCIQEAEHGLLPLPILSGKEGPGGCLGQAVFAMRKRQTAFRRHDSSQ